MLCLALVATVASVTSMVAQAGSDILGAFSARPETVVYHLIETDGRYLTYRPDVSGGRDEFLFMAKSPWTGAPEEMAAYPIEVAGSDDPAEQGVVIRTVYRRYLALLYPLPIEERSDYRAVVSVAESIELNSRG